MIDSCLSTNWLGDWQKNTCTRCKWTDEKGRGEKRPRLYSRYCCLRIPQYSYRNSSPVCNSHTLLFFGSRYGQALMGLIKYSTDASSYIDENTSAVVKSSLKFYPKLFSQNLVHSILLETFQSNITKSLPKFYWKFSSKLYWWEYERTSQIFC